MPPGDPNPSAAAIRRASFLAAYAELAGAGLDDPAIATALGLSTTALYFRLRRAGQADAIAARKAADRQRRARATTQRRVSFLAAYDEARRQGLDAPAVAARLGVSVPAMNKRLRRAGRPGFWMGER